MFKKIDSIDQLQSVLPVDYNISSRGGYVAIDPSAVCDYLQSRHIKVSPSDLPRKFGAYCNYLGGGIRGAICETQFNPKLSITAQKYLSELSAACKRVYLSLDSNDPDNWDDIGTNAARAAGITRAY